MPCPHESLYKDAPEIQPLRLTPGESLATFLDALGGTCFEARNLHRGATLWQRMLDQNQTLWLGIAGAGIAGGLGGVVVQLIERGFVDVICTTGAQAYHDLHFAFGLPVKAVSPHGDDDELRRHGDTRIYDIGIREEETLKAQDEIIGRFVVEEYEALRDRNLSSAAFMETLGKWAARNAPHPERSFVIAAAEAGVPVFWDSLTNHSIAMTLARLSLTGYGVRLDAHADILLSAALAYADDRPLGFVELGGGGPKNFIQQTGPTVSQMLGIDDFHGASCGLQISTANVREGSLSSCTFGEAVTWGKYEADEAANLVQIWGEYSVLFPMLAGYVLERCRARPQRSLFGSMQSMLENLVADSPVSS